MSLSNTGIDRFLQQNYYSKTQLNAGQLDSRYYAESEFLATSAGAGDAGKPVKLNSSGQVDATMYGSTVVTLTDTQTLTNKTLTAPNFGLSNWTIGTLSSNPLINWDSNDYVTYDRTGNSLNFIVNSATPLAITQTGLAITGTLTIGGVTVPTISSTSTLTNKTLTSPVISTIVNTGTLTLPTSTDTLVGRATTDTLTNKTLTSPNFGLTNWTIGTLTTNPLINWDSNDYVTYDRTGNSVQFVVNSTNPVNITASGLAVTGALTLGGVNVPTISSTDTLTNKTITDPLIGRTYGGSAANDDITIHGTSSATRTSSYVILQPSGGNTVVGGSTTDHRFEVQDAGASNYRITMNLNVSGVNYLNSYSAAPGTLTAAPLTLVSSALGTTGDTFRIETSKTPASAAASGNAGQIAWDTSFLYIATGTNQWRRISHASW